LTIGDKNQSPDFFHFKKFELFSKKSKGSKGRKNNKWQIAGIDCF